MADNDGQWERGLIEKLATAALKEQRRARLWGIFFKLLTFAYVTVIILLAIDWKSLGETTGKHTALVEVSGLIAPGTDASAEHVTSALQAAFKDKNTVGVVVRINSPGGSPVQAQGIYEEMRRLRQKNPAVPLYAVVEDLCASGGYYVAAGADRIYVAKSSLVGSIGVRMDSFGVTGLIWTGQKSVELGLADAFGSLDYVAREVIKAENIVDYTQKDNIAEKFARRFGAGAAGAILELALRHAPQLR